jgi:hypothetical protein
MWRRGSDRQDDLFRPTVGFHIIVGSTTAAIGAIEAFQFGGVTDAFKFSGLSDNIPIAGG